jgi:hypothetical protein
VTKDQSADLRAKFWTHSAFSETRSEDWSSSQSQKIGYPLLSNEEYFSTRISKSTLLSRCFFRSPNQHRFHSRFSTLYSTLLPYSTSQALHTSQVNCQNFMRKSSQEGRHVGASLNEASRMWADEFSPAPRKRSGMNFKIPPEQATMQNGGK